MALLESMLQFTGSMGNISAYRMRGVDKIVIRKKGGATRRQIQKSPRFAKTRLHNTEFSGRARGVHWTMAAIRPLKVVADHIISGPINGLMKYFQDLDQEREVGQRSIRFSKHASILEGFSFNKDTSLDIIVTAPLNYTISRETGSATIGIPELIPGANFFPPKEYPMFCVMAVLGVAPDLYYTPRAHNKYTPSNDSYPRVPEDVTTAWLPTSEISPAMTLTVALKSPPPADDYALLLSVGICFGSKTPIGTVALAKHAGAGKIVAVA